MKRSLLPRVPDFRRPLFLLLALATAPAAFAQAVAIAAATGQVVDPTGSAVAGAAVNMIETEKGVSHTTKTDAGGRYSLPTLPVGPYRLEASASGFKTYVQSGIVLQVGQRVEFNVTLQVGDVSQNVEVTASANMVQTVQNTVSQVIDQRRIVDMPLNGRQATQLVLISGAAVTTPAGDNTGSKNYFSSTTISVAGGQGTGTNYLLDGGYNVDTFSNVNLPFPFPDAIQEFSVETSSLPARNGVLPGGVVNIVTKSGSNAWHGDLFEFLRNGDVNARNFFAPVHDSLKRNQFGGTVGGKIIRDKLFFFAGYQGTRNRQNPPQTTSFIPTPAALNGDFSTLESATCQSNQKPRTIRDPITQFPIPDNRVNPANFDPAALKLMSYLPATSDPCGRVVYGIPTTGDEDQVIGRVDWARSSNHTVFGRYFIADYRNPAVFNPTNILVTTNPGNLERAQSVTLGDTYTFGPTTVNSFHATFTRRRDNRGPSPQQINVRDLGVNMAVYVPNDIRISVSNAFNAGCGTCSPGHFNVNTYQVSDDVDIVRGKHQIAVGADFVRSQLNSNAGYLQNGNFSFNGTVTNDPMLDFLYGAMSGFSQSRPQQVSMRGMFPSVYAQDTIHVNPHLVVNAGLRWEPMIFPTDYFHRGSTFSFAGFLAGEKSSVYTNAPAGSLYYGDPGVPASFTNNRWTNFSPRFGIVWDPKGDGRQTLRAGGALLYNATMLYLSQRLTSNPPIVNEIDLATSAPGGFSNPWTTGYNYPGGNPFPGIYPPPSNAPFPTAALYIVLPPNPHPTSIGQWNLSYQRQISTDWLASVSYLGNKTSHLWVGQELNPAIYIPGTCSGKPCSTTSNTNQRKILNQINASQGQYYGNVDIADDGANANYNALLVSLQHRFSRNYTVLVNYTWSHCISEADFGGDITGPSYMIPSNRAADRANCNFDVRHLFNASLVATSPFKGRSWKGRLLGNWQIAPLIRVQSGLPVNITTGTDNSLTGVNLDRPNQVLPDLYSAHLGPGIQWLSPAALTANPLGTYGNLARDAARAPGQFNFDAALSRTFTLTEHFHLDARAEAFNVINHTNFNAPNSTLNSANYGRITGAGDPRIFQFAMKLLF